MAARKGIKAKVSAWLRENPDTQVTTRELERMYVQHGGSVMGPDVQPPRDRGRVSRDSLKRFVQSLPVRLVRNGRTSSFDTWVYDKNVEEERLREAELTRQTRAAWRQRQDPTVP